MGYVINKSYINEIVVEKSRFIALLCPLTNENDFDEYFKESKTTYKDARHYTYAFRYTFNMQLFIESIQCFLFRIKL